MTATEYIRWCLVLADEKNERTPEMWYHAQTTSALHCVPFWVWGKTPPAGLEKPETFLLKFVNESDKPEEREKSEEELREEATRKSMGSGWGAFLKVDQQRPSGEKKTLPPGVVNMGDVKQNSETPQPVKETPVPPVPNVKPPRKGPKRPQIERLAQKRP